MRSPHLMHVRLQALEALVVAVAALPALSAARPENIKISIGDQERSKRSQSGTGRRGHRGSACLAPYKGKSARSSAFGGVPRSWKTAQAARGRVVPPRGVPGHQTGWRVCQRDVVSRRSSYARAVDQRVGGIFQKIAGWRLTGAGRACRFQDEELSTRRLARG